jgi:GH3 auxin-responsive promoter
MGDRVRATHYYHQTLCLEFLGRSGGISDMVGEKLNPDFVRDMLRELRLVSGFKTLVPVKEPAHYILLLDCESDVPNAAELDKLLCRSHHYAQARSLGQLEAAQVMARSDMAEVWAKLRMRNGARWGDVKDETLASQPIYIDALRSCTDR